MTLVFQIFFKQNVKTKYYVFIPFPPETIPRVFKSTQDREEVETWNMI